MTDVDASIKDPSPVDVFIVSPIGSQNTPGHVQAKNVLEYLIKKALPAPEWNVIRADDDESPDSITQKVVGRIIGANLVIVDISNFNPNVFYELAIAHCYRRPVVIIAEEGTQSPFDIADQTRIDYDLTDPASLYAAQEKLERAARIALENPDSLKTPLSMYRAVSATAEKIAEGDQDELTMLLTTVASRLGRLESEVSRLGRDRADHLSWRKMPPLSRTLQAAEGRIQRFENSPGGSEAMALARAREDLMQSLRTRPLSPDMAKTVGGLLNRIEDLLEEHGYRIEASGQID